MRRGDNIPPVSDYSHWNEEAEIMWFQENRYDMEHPDEIIDDGFDDDWEPDIEEKEFETEAEAREFMDQRGRDWGIHFDNANLCRSKEGVWYVEYWKDRKRNA